ncbi:hypothetical protein APR03_002215 [Promicromonospora thailandica]|uniref:Uncharacterized protein n=1 Tax=Promicromonospora thailandica TaxID=765201 RepID=A0A9X2JVV2_9MICO|nr:hypothetical protein [Promicromonospora thailandica]BFF18869.1 hypothetical protein GCM10025730_23900 [Promicromonospora thailandica]
MPPIDIHYVDVVFRPLDPPITVVAMTKAAARTALVTPRHEMRMPAMPTCACDRCRSCLH